MVPPGRSILAKTTLEATKLDRNSSVSWRKNGIVGLEIFGRIDFWNKHED